MAGARNESSSVYLIPAILDEDKIVLLPGCAMIYEIRVGAFRVALLGALAFQLASILPSTRA
jgi:hypothetical protein